MVDFESLMSKVQWLITELDDIRDTAVRLQRALELGAEHANATEKDRTASVAALSLSRASTDTSVLAGPSDRHTPDRWMERRGSIPLVALGFEDLTSQAGL